MNLSSLIGQLDLLLSMWGAKANPDLFVELPDGSLLPVSGLRGTAGQGQDLRMVLTIAAPAKEESPA